MMTRKTVLPIPARALQSNALILGKPGAGKSALARLLFEHENDVGHRACFVDPMGDAAGIRLTKEGEPSRFKNIVIMGGPHADIPITDGDGAKAGKFVGQTDRSFLIDLSDMLQSEQLRFMGGFAESLYENIAVPVALFVDEAHLFAPQERGEASSYLINRMTRLNSQGRKRGIFLFLMTQRPARISKNIIAGTETLIAMKMTTPRDIDAMEEWLSAHDSDQAKSVRTSVPKLKPGEAIVWYPGGDFFQQVQFPMHSTFDSGRTPEHGERVGMQQIAKVGDIADLAAAFGGVSLVDARDEEIAALSAKLSDQMQDAARLRADLRTVTHERDQVTVREERLLGLLLALQVRIGAAIGSPQIEPLPITVHYEKFLMIAGADGVIRGVPREGDSTALVPAARRRMRSAKLPTAAPTSAPTKPSRARRKKP